MAPAARLLHPVPPFATGRMPVTSEARLTSEVATAPAVARKRPVRLPMVSAVEATTADELAVPETERFVEVALASVVLPLKTLALEKVLAVVVEKALVKTP